MPSRGNQDNPKTEVERVLAEFDGKKDDLTFFGETTKRLIEEFLKDAKIRYQSIQARVKTREKLKAKYLDPQKDYKKLDDITDQVALRVITYYEDEVDRVAEVIKREFDIDTNNSIDKRETEPDKFGYYALNFVCKYSQGRTSHVEYRKFTGVWFEIQITSVLRHAWSEIEHPWYDLKDAFPPNIKRRFARMAALLEIAESEFLDLRKLQSDYQRSVAVQVEAQVSDLPVDSVSLKSFIETEPLVREIDQLIASVVHKPMSTDVPSDQVLERRAATLNAAGITKLQDLRENLKKYRTSIPEFIRRCRQENVWPATPINQVQTSISLHQLAQMIASLRGTEALAAFYKDTGLNPTWDFGKQAAMARDVSRK
jgi:putative GTP pyrophosphokinase